LGEGYPDSGKYIFDVEKADEIAEKLLNGEKLFLSPLIWAFRRGARALDEKAARARVSNP
jgi:hypothetical protein